MKDGTEEPFNNVFRRIWKYNGYSVEVRFNKLENGTIAIADAFVREGVQL